jgi:hypothetical protein
MGIFRSQSDFNFSAIFRRPNRKIVVACIWTFSGIALVGLIPYFFRHQSKVVEEKPIVTEAQVIEAELVSAKGTVMVRKLGRTAWQEVRVGARLQEGDLIQTDDSGVASIRYSNGATLLIQKDTIFTVQDASGGIMEITAPPQLAMLQNRTSRNTADAIHGSNGMILSEAKAGEQRPSIELQRIIPFGKSLELIGQVEAGSRLLVNGESVEIAGDGTFKHFTNPFPALASKVNIVMRVTNLAGQTRTLRTVYDFSSSGGEN